MTDICTYSYINSNSRSESVSPNMGVSFENTRKYLYPEIEPYETGHLQVSNMHSIYYEQSGKPEGNPVIFLHGGPGLGTSGRDRRFFDPSVYRIILFDQRGAGKSKPAAEIRQNTTWDLVEDIERLRKHLHIQKWVVFGGSWGATLALAYATRYTDQVKAMVLRGVYTLRRKEISWLYQEGASKFFPEKWEHFLKPIPEVERFDMLSAYYRRLMSEDETTRTEAAKAWSLWEMSTARMQVDNQLTKRVDDTFWAQQKATLEVHYFVNGGFMSYDGQLLDDAAKLRSIQATIIQGRYDVVCPVDTAWELHKRWPEADFHIVPDCGHSTKEENICRMLVLAADRYKHL